jgi:hypothetical protein
VDDEVLFFVRVCAMCLGGVMGSVGAYSFCCQLRGYIVGYNG